MTDAQILTAPIAGEAEFIPSPTYIAKQAEEKDHKEWEHALAVLDHTVKSFEGDNPTDDQIIARLERIWVWMNS